MLTDDITSFLVVAWRWVQGAWARSMFVVLALWLGLWIGEMRTEFRIVADCKYAGVFRSDIQAYTCQRRL